MVDGPRIGKISGNARIDPRDMEEPEGDTKENFKMWLVDSLRDPDFLNDINDVLMEWETAIRKANIDPSTFAVGLHPKIVII